MARFAVTVQSVRMVPFCLEYVYYNNFFPVLPRAHFDLSVGVPEQQRHQTIALPALGGARRAFGRSGLAGAVDAAHGRLAVDLISLVHFGAVVADAPSPLSTPRSAAGQAPLRLGKPLRKKCRASPELLFKRAGRVVAGTVGIVRATVPFHGEHDALEPTKEGLRCCGCH